MSSEQVCRVGSCRDSASLQSAPKVSVSGVSRYLGMNACSCHRWIEIGAALWGGDLEYRGKVKGSARASKLQEINASMFSDS